MNDNPTPEENDPIPLSLLNQYAYCPRRCYLIYAEGEFEDNVHTLRGTHEHERVDQLRHEVTAGVRVEYRLPLWSRRLRLSGRCDVVEFHPDGTIYPVEYKHGKRKRWFNDDLQLAGQAMCLEESLGKSVVKGAIYHIQSRRRREVEITPALKEAVEQAVPAMRQLLSQDKAPPPIEDRRRCKECSMINVCQPDMVASRSRLLRLRTTLFNPEDEEPCTSC